MNSTNSYQNSKHPNAYSWPASINDQVEPEEVTSAELQLKVVLLNNRVDMLSNMLEKLLNDKQQEKKQQLSITI